MQALRQHILLRQRDYRRRPFFDFVRDDTLRLDDRIAYFPCMAGFVMGYGDLHEHALRAQQMGDECTAAPPARGRKAPQHGHWYLDHLASLGFDLVARPSETLQLLHGPDCAQGRLLAMRLAHLVWAAAPTARQAVIEAIEQASQFLFALTAALAARRRSSREQAPHDIDASRSERQTNPRPLDGPAPLTHDVLDDMSRRDALQRVDSVYAQFGSWTDELLAFARARSPGQALRRRVGAVG